MIWQGLIICVVVLELFSGGTVVCESEIPSFIKICHLSDPDLNNCIKESINTLKPYLKTGIPAFQMPAVDPSPFDDVKYERTGINNLKMKCTNVYISGGSDFELRNVSFDPEYNNLGLKLHFPRLNIIADYTLRGSVFFVRFSGNDKIHAILRNVDVTIFAKLNSYQNSTTGLNHRRLEEVYAGVRVGHCSMNVNNIQPIFASPTVNMFLNLNWRPLVKKLTPDLAQNFANMFDTYSNKVFRAFPENVLLPL